MRNVIQSGVALLVIVASLAFTGIGIARAATGYKWSPLSRQGPPLLRLSAFDETSTPSPTESIEPSESPEPTRISETETPDDDMKESSGQQGESEMESDDSDEQGEDSGSFYGTPQPGYHHHSGPAGAPSSGEDDGGDD